jgi:hypothetical protein
VEEDTLRKVGPALAEREAPSFRPARLGVDSPKQPMLMLEEEYEEKIMAEIAQSINE